jgi:hypothetical protein
MARGDGGKNVFEVDKDRFAWTDLLSSKETTEAQRNTEDTEDRNDGNWNIKGCVTGRPL